MFVDDTAMFMKIIIKSAFKADFFPLTHKKKQKGIIFTSVQFSFNWHTDTPETMKVLLLFAFFADDALNWFLLALDRWIVLYFSKVPTPPLEELTSSKIPTRYNRRKNPVQSQYICVKWNLIKDCFKD